MLPSCEEKHDFKHRLDTKAEKYYIIGGQDSDAFPVTKISDWKRIWGSLENG